jgi:hypothetical protein
MFRLEIFFNEMIEKVNDLELILEKKRVDKKK